MIRAQHTATHCNTLQRISTHCNLRRLHGRRQTALSHLVSSRQTRARRNNIVARPWREGPSRRVSDGSSMQRVVGGVRARECDGTGSLALSLLPFLSISLSFSRSLSLSCSLSFSLSLSLSLSFFLSFSLSLFHVLSLSISFSIYRSIHPSMFIHVCFFKACNLRHTYI